VASAVIEQASIARCAMPKGRYKEMISSNVLGISLHKRSPTSFYDFGEQNEYSNEAVS
jgi:hypothetical protein